MNVSPESIRAHEPSLIEDISPPHTEQYTDVEREEVRRRPIGSLYQQYLKNSKAKVNSLRKKKALEKQKKMVQAPVQVIEPVRPRQKHSVVPPLQSLSSVKMEPLSDTSYDTGQSSLVSRVRAGIAHDKEWVVERFGGIKESLSIFWLTITGWIYAIALKIFPKRYTAQSGLVIDWDAPSVSRTKVVLPVLVAAFLVFSIFAAGSEIVKNPSFKKQNSATSSDTSSNSSASASNPSSGSKPGGGSGSASAASPINTTTPSTIDKTTTQSTPPATSTSSLPVGGMGGGGYSVQIPTPTPTPAPANSIPPTNTITVPQTQVQVGDKTLLQTNDLNLTIN